MPVEWIAAHKELTAWILFAFVIFVITPAHVWWYKHRERSLLSAWLIAVPVYLLAVLPAAMILRFWRPLTETLPISDQAKQVAWFLGIGVGILIANVVWVMFQRFIKRPPAAPT